jgi:peptide/nickel transport system substrate-binding protein
MKANRGVNLMLSLITVATALVTACSPASSTSSGQPAGTPTAPTKMTGVMLGDRGIFNTIANLGGARVPGSDTLFRAVNAGMTQEKPDGVRVAQLGTSVPSTSDGSWKLLPDGRMEMYFSLKPGVFWHDGTPVTSADLAFQVKVTQDAASGLRGGVAPNYVDGAEVVDTNTVMVKWRAPYIDADQYFSQILAPKHILEGPYEAGAAMPELSHWRRDFVGAGPYKVKQYEPDAFAILEAFDQYALGRPKIDLLEVKFMTDSNSVIANLLSGQLDLVLDIFDPEQVSEAVRQWSAGRLLVDGGQPVGLYPQHINPNPTMLSNPRFRAALLMGIDRQALVDELQGGYGEISHQNFFPTASWQYPYIEKDIVKYPYDQRQAMAALEALGLTKGPDGFFRDASGAALTQVESRTVARQEKTNVIIVEMWKAIGVNAQAVTIPQQLATDREYRSTFPGFQLLQSGDSPASLHSREVALASNNWVGNNRGRYADPAFDALADRYYATVPIDERMRTMGQIVRMVTEQNIAMPTFLRARGYLLANRVAGASVSLWDVEKWSIAT